MKNHEKEIKRLLSDDMLRPSDSFKRSLKKDMMKRSRGQVMSNRWWITPVIGTAVLAVAIVGMQLWSSSNPNSVVKNPFQAQTVSAKELIRKINDAPATLGESGKSFMIQKYSTTVGPRAGWCGSAQYGSSIMNNSKGENYFYNSKENGHEAQYTKYVEEGEKPRVWESMYYSKNAEELQFAGTGFGDAIPYQSGGMYEVQGQPLYLIVDRNGDQLKDDTLRSHIVDGREVYEFYVKENVAVTGDYTPEPKDGSIPCDSTKTLSGVTVDAKTNAVVKTTQYVGSVSDDNLYFVYKYETKLEDVSESKALEIMKKAGFVKERATDTIPVGKGLQ
jgi:hypothetical protein